MSTVFRVHYRTEFGEFISIRGSSHGLSWEEGHDATWGLRENGEHVWELVLSAGSVGSDSVIRFKPLINDEVWAKGTDYIVRAGEVIDIYPFFFATAGTIFKTPFHSQLLDNWRKIAVYLPPSYHENSFKRYPVILYQDGHNLFDPKDSFCGNTWQLGETMDDLCCNGAIQEYIIVGVYPVKREHEYLPTKGSNGTGGGADKYLDAMTQELRPSIDAHLRTTQSYGIAGSSYGGLISLYAWVTRPEAFDVCGAFSPSLRFDNSMLVDVVKRQLHSRPDHHKLYMDAGSLRDGCESVIAMANYLIRDQTLRDGQFLFVLGEGHEHTERHWAIRAPGALAFMLADPQRVPGSTQKAKRPEKVM